MGVKVAGSTRRCVPTLEAKLPFHRAETGGEHIPVRGNSSDLLERGRPSRGDRQRAWIAVLGPHNTW